MPNSLWMFAYVILLFSIQVSLLLDAGIIHLPANEEEDDGLWAYIQRKTAFLQLGYSQ